MNRDVDINPVTGVLNQSEYYPGTTSLIYEGREWSYRQLADEVAALARAFSAGGVLAGDRVAYLGLNSVTFIETMLASWWLKAVFEPLNFRLAPAEVAGLLEQSDPKVLVVEPCHLDVVERIRQSTPERLEGIQLILVDNDPAVPAPAEVPEAYLLLSAHLDGASGAELPEPLAATEDDLAILMFTSGTTGRPKGVQLTHGNVWWNSVNVDSVVDTRRGDTNLAVAPLFHIGGLNALTIRVLARGGRNVVRRTFDPRQTIRDIAEYGVSQSFLVPAMLSAMYATEEFEQYDISSLRSLICAGAPVPPVLLRQYESKGVPVQQAWGLTETSPFATYLATELTYVKPGSCGLPMPYTKIRIADPITGEDVQEAGATGELWVKGPNVTRGYWNNPEATATAFADGWFRSGDIGYRDEEGFIFIVDRLKDMIITGGENVYPAEVERALMEFPGALDAAVVGVPDEKWGESVVAVMTFKAGITPTIEEIREFAATLLARYKLPKELVLTTEMPRNGSGKLDKPAIRTLVQKEMSTP